MGTRGRASLGRGPCSVPGRGQGGPPVPVPAPKPPTLPEELPRLGLSLLQPASPGVFGDPRVPLGCDTPPAPRHREPQAPRTRQKPLTPAVAQTLQHQRHQLRKIPPMQGAPVQRPRQSSPAPHHGELPRGEPAGPRAALAAARGSGLLLLTVLAACADNSDREPLRSRY